MQHFYVHFVKFPCNRCHFNLNLHCSSSCRWLPFPRSAPVRWAIFSPVKAAAGWNDAMLGGLWQEVFAVLNNDGTPVTASVVDARLVRQTTTEETVGEDPVVVPAASHAPHVVAVGCRVRRQVSRPAPTRRRRWRHFRWRQQQYGGRQSQRDAQSLHKAVRRRHL